MVANATGCSSIYGGNLPVTPWAKNSRSGRGPAWSNSLFEDNAEFGLGFRLAADQHLELSRTVRWPGHWPWRLGADLVEAILSAPQLQESEIRAQRGRVATLIERLHTMDKDPAAKDLLSVVDHLVRRSIWIVGGDGWAYDIGYGGLDHVLATSRDVNVQVMDTPRSYPTPAVSLQGNPHWARSPNLPPPANALLARIWHCRQSPTGTFMWRRSPWAPIRSRRFSRSARPRPTPDRHWILAYSHCIAHGIDMRFGMKQQDLAVASWLLGAVPIRSGNASRG